jgi:hypothetical protein
VGSWILTVFFLFRLDATILDFIVREIHAQDKWAQHFPVAQGPRVIVTGGSSCTFSIDAGMATEQFHVPVINAGLGATMGSSGVYLEASRLLRPGDTLVLAMELPLYSGATTYSQEALQAFAVQGDYQLIARAREITGRSIPLDHLVVAPRPGLEKFSASAGRWLTGTSFRYSLARIKPGGLMVTDVRLRFPEDFIKPTLDEENRKLLVHFRDWAARQGVQVICAIPWSYTDPVFAARQKMLTAAFVSDISKILPVVHEEDLGVQVDPSCFADTNVHLTEAAAQVRTKELMEKVLAHDYWTAKTLAPFLAQH